jgi:hypothetical protein
VTAIDVERDGSAFRLSATLFAPVPQTLAWEVLTDFDHMAAFVPNLVSSRVVARDGNVLTIEQRGTAKFGLLAFAFDSARQVDLFPPHEIRSNQLSGNMRRMESLTRFAARDGGTSLTYRVDVVPGAYYPAALTERFLRHEVAEQFEAIVQEMLRRKAARGL